MSKDQRPTVVEWLWPYFQFDPSKSPCVGRILGLILLLIFGVLTVGIAGALWGFIEAVFRFGPYDGLSTDEAIRNFGLFLVAVFGAPFLIWRARVAQLQANVAEQGHITDRINQSVQGLGAEKTVKRHRTNNLGKLLYENSSDGKVDLKKPIFDELTLPNLEVRIGSIYALERVANESANDREQIFEILCAYVSNNHYIPETFPYPPMERFSDEDPEPGINERFRGGSIGLGRSWAHKLKKPRPDTRAAIEVIVRTIKRYAGDRDVSNTQTLMFSGANLQRANLRGANLAGAWFEGCQLDGVDLENSDLSNATFFNCSLVGASINGADLTKTAFRGSRLECVNAGNIKRMSGCYFFDCDCSGGMFDGSDMTGSHFSVTARRASFRVEQMNDTHFSMCDIRDGEISAHSMKGLGISATWVPETGVQLMERVQHGGGASTTRMAKRVRLFAHPFNSNLVNSTKFSGHSKSKEEIEQGGAELFDP